MKYERLYPPAAGTHTRRPPPLARVPIASVPRNFATGHMLALVTLFALGFSLLAYLKAEGGWYLGCGLFIVPIVLGQMFLFGGRQPRLASCIVGACTMPVLVLGFVIAVDGSNLMRGGFAEAVLRFAAVTVGTAIPSAILGLLSGYLAGTLCAGVFLVTERRWDAGKAIPFEPIIAEVVPEEGDEPNAIETKGEATSDGDPWSND